MAGVDNHKKQVEHNQLCYDYLIKAESELYHDWCTTVLFYKALHMVDQYLARYKLEPKNHDDRQDHIKKYLPDIRLEYYHLYQASIKSRYETDYLSIPDKGKGYHKRILENSFIPLAKKMEKVLSAAGP